MKTPNVLCMCMVLLLAGCGPSVHFVRNPSAQVQHARTYAFLPNLDSISFSVEDKELIDGMVFRSVMAALNTRGLAHDGTGPDLLVRFRVNLQDKSSTASVPNYAFPSAAAPNRFYYPNPYTTYTSGNTRTVHYNEGMLILEFFTAHDGQLLWRTWCRTVVGSIQKFEQALPDRVEKMISKVPLGSNQ